MMWLSFAIGILVLNTVNSFSSRSSIQRKPSVSTITLYKTLFFAEEVVESEQPKIVNGANGAAIELSVYEKLGINEPDLALGVNADELLQHVGTRLDLIEKCMNDVKGFDRDRATKEVDKFLMDAEMVNTLIAFNKRYPDGVEDSLNPANIFRTYINWFAGGLALLYVKNTFIMPKVESGEWKFPFGLFERSTATDILDDSGAMDVVTSNAGTIDVVTGAVNDITGSNI